jgi:pteridine reductase
MTEPVVVITGAGRRLGRHMAETFHAAGYRLVLHCNHSAQEADALCEALNRQRHDSAAVVQAELTAPDIDELVRQLLAPFGRIDHLINNASAFYPTPVSEITPAQFDELISINLRTPYLLGCALASALTDGSIINLVDIYGDKPLSGYSAYSISKAGLIMATRALALELAPAVRVNGIAPGAILWPEGESAASDNWQNLLETIPLGRLGDADNIAEAALFLVSTDYVTGHILTVDGGSSLA